MTGILHVLVEGRIMGQVRQDARGRLSFGYEDSWRSLTGAYPLSLSMPLAADTHPHADIEPWLWGLLPDNERTLDRWAKRFHVSARNAFGLLGQVGEDCAGAVQFVRPERLETLRLGTADAVEWLDEADLAHRLKLLRQDAGAARLQGDGGQFSLAGAQAKTALAFKDGRWGVPSGRLPTTHILKPPIEGFAGHAENEHFCLCLARALGMPVARSEVLHFADETVISVERYDRIHMGDTIRRLHQEDLCQALSIMPMRKYQNEGGPSPSAMLAVIRQHSSAPDADALTFLRAMIFNWLIGGTDAHPKNFSLLIGTGGKVRLAPLYDLASIFGYDHELRTLRLANKIGGTYQLGDIGVRQWQKFAVETRLEPDLVAHEVRFMTVGMPEAVAGIAARLGQEGLKHPIIERLSVALVGRAQDCGRLFDPAA